MHNRDEDYATYGSLAHIDNLFDFPVSITFRRYEDHLLGRESPSYPPQKEAPPQKGGHRPDKVIFMRAAPIETKRRGEEKQHGFRDVQA